MAVTVVPADFIYPTGELQQKQFPSENLTTNVQAWITQATGKVASVAADVQDAAASHWVYYRAYKAIAKRIASNPTRESFGGNSGGGVQSTVDWGNNKSEYWEGLAQTELENFQDYVPEVPPPDNQPLFLVM